MAVLNPAGSFVPTTNIWDSPYILEVDESTRQLFILLYQDVNRIALGLNDKDTGIYDNTMAFTNSQTWFPNPNTPSNCHMPIDARLFGQ